jgi:hypothetical protein
MWFWAGFTVLTALAAIAIIAVVARAEVLLDVHHATTTAVVKSIHQGKDNDNAEITFMAGGSDLVTTRVQIAPFGKDPAIGSHIAIEYVPDQPTLARRAGAHDLTPFLLIVGPAVVLVVVPLFRRWRRIRR